MFPERYPPLKSWIIAGVIIIALFVLCDLFSAKYGETISLEQRKLQGKHLLDNALNNIDAGPDKVQIVVVGSSIVGNGVACATEYENKYSNVCLSKLYLNSYSEILKLYDTIGAFDSLLVHVPDILLIQVDLLAYTFEKTDLSERFFRGAYFLYDLNFSMTKQSHKYKMLRYCGTINKGTIPDTSLYKPIKMEPALFKDRSFIHSKLQALSNRGVKIYLIHVPRPSATESILHQEIRDEKFHQLMNEYHMLCQSTYLEFPEKLTFKYFHDFAHLNNAGRRKYSDWLYSNILKAKQ